MERLLIVIDCTSPLSTEWFDLHNVNDVLLSEMRLDWESTLDDSIIGESS